MVREITIDMRPPGLLDRLWHRRLGTEPPALSGHSGPRHHKLARLMPYAWRRAHRDYAHAFGYFWLPCPSCGHEFGGHEAGADVPDPRKGPGHGRTVCSRCTRRMADAAS